MKRCGAHLPLCPHEPVKDERGITGVGVGTADFCKEWRKCSVHVRRTAQQPQGPAEGSRAGFWVVAAAPHPLAAAAGGAERASG